MYVSGQLYDFESRLHQLVTGLSDLNSFITEGNAYLTAYPFLSSGTSQKWEREAKISKFRVTLNPGALISGIFSAGTSLPGAPVLSVDGFGTFSWSAVSTATGYKIYTNSSSYPISYSDQDCSLAPTFFWKITGATSFLDIAYTNTSSNAVAVSALNSAGEGPKSTCLANGF
jgi:hypothetical protein